MKRVLAYLILLAGTSFALGCTSKSEKAAEPNFVPAGFDVPTVLVATGFQLRPIAVADAEEDYEAVMESKLDLRALFGGEWPEDDFSLAQNRADIQTHVKAFQDRESFTYSIISPDQQRILGCVYVHPSEEADAQVFFWIRTSERGQGLDPILQGELFDWLTRDWPFSTVKFPGRE